MHTDGRNPAPSPSLICASSSLELPLPPRGVPIRVAPATWPPPDILLSTTLPVGRCPSQSEDPVSGDAAHPDAPHTAILPSPEDLLFMREMVLLVRCLSPHSQGSVCTTWNILSI